MDRFRWILRSEEKRLVVTPLQRRDPWWTTASKTCRLRAGSLIKLSLGDIRKVNGLKLKCLIKLIFKVVDKYKMK
jgi:hypothetical protein